MIMTTVLIMMVLVVTIVYKMENVIQLVLETNILQLVELKKQENTSQKVLAHIKMKVVEIISEQAILLI